MGEPKVGCHEVRRHEILRFRFPEIHHSSNCTALRRRGVIVGLLASNTRGVPLCRDNWMLWAENFRFRNRKNKPDCILDSQCNFFCISQFRQNLPDSISLCFTVVLESGRNYQIAFCIPGAFFFVFLNPVETTTFLRFPVETYQIFWGPSRLLQYFLHISSTRPCHGRVAQYLDRLQLWRLHQSLDFCTC